MALHGRIEINESTIITWVAERKTFDEGVGTYLCNVTSWTPMDQHHQQYSETFELRHLLEDGAAMLVVDMLHEFERRHPYKDER